MFASPWWLVVVFFNLKGTKVGRPFVKQLLDLAMNILSFYQIGKGERGIGSQASLMWFKEALCNWKRQFCPILMFRYSFLFLLLSVGSFELLTSPSDSITFDFYTLKMIESVFWGILLLAIICIYFVTWHVCKNGCIIVYILVCFVEVDFAILEAAEDMQVAGCNNYI